MKKEYRTPELEVIYFSFEDVITTSSGTSSSGLIDGATGGTGDNYQFGNIIKP